jgi:hypothetical protein
MPDDTAMTVRRLTRQLRASRKHAAICEHAFVEQAMAGRAALRMIGDAIEELFGPIANLESEDGTLWRGPELHHRAEAIIEALQRVAAQLDRRGKAE